MPIDTVSRIQYEHGMDPTEWAVTLVKFDLEARDEVTSGAIAPSPAASLTLLDQSDEAYARRIVAKLLNAGWAPPDVSALRKGETE
jgi:hypothetical protein